MTTAAPAPLPPTVADPGDRIRLYDVAPIAFIHLLCLGVLWVGWSPVAVAVAVVVAAVRMFVITAFYHRYFSHRTFRTHRWVQLAAAVVGTTCAQRGPLWWASHHRQHHRHSDQPRDLHSPVHRGLLWSHAGWFLARDGLVTHWRSIPDLARFPELLWVERLHMLGPFALAGAMFGLGVWLEGVAPGLGTDGWQMAVWGFAVSTTVLYHATFTINSLAHRWGKRRYETPDDSRNNGFLSLITLGEGWHNNHHFHPGTARQGFRWWEFDPTYYILKTLEKLRIVKDVRGVPKRVVEAGKNASKPGHKETA